MQVVRGNEGRHVKPPLGVMPWNLWAEQFEGGPDMKALVDRHAEVLAAIDRYRESGLSIPIIWMIEVGLIWRHR